MLPHTVEDLSFVLGFLRADRGTRSTWPTRYCAFVWLAIVVLIPFDLETVFKKKLFLRSWSSGRATFLIAGQRVMLPQ